MAFLQNSQPDLCLLAKSGGCSVYQLRNESGEGTMTVYEVFPGATILYNDFHMAYCDSSFETRQDLLCIDYCREGRMEYAVGNDAFSYVEAGDLKVDRRLKHKGYFSLPLSHYHGISMCFDLSMIPMELARLAGDYPWIWLPSSRNSARMPGHGSFTEHPRWITFFRSCVPYRSGSKCPTFG